MILPHPTQTYWNFSLEVGGQQCVLAALQVPHWHNKVWEVNKWEHICLDSVCNLAFPKAGPLICAQGLCQGGNRMKRRNYIKNVGFFFFLVILPAFIQHVVFFFFFWPSTKCQSEHNGCGVFGSMEQIWEGCEMDSHSTRASQAGKQLDWRTWRVWQGLRGGPRFVKERRKEGREEGKKGGRKGRKK